eukprot:121856-Pyramimonas_sp.AAC.1
MAMEWLLTCFGIVPCRAPVAAPNDRWCQSHAWGGPSEVPREACRRRASHAPLEALRMRARGSTAGGMPLARFKLCRTRAAGGASSVRLKCRQSSIV